jgi:hypothetical protein
MGMIYALIAYSHHPLRVFRYTKQRDLLMVKEVPKYGLRLYNLIKSFKKFILEENFLVTNTILTSNGCL